MVQILGHSKTLDIKTGDQSTKLLLDVQVTCGVLTHDL
jgi:hypothetical protein